MQFVTAEPATAHVQRLCAAGLSHAQIARQAGCARGRISDLNSGRTKNMRPSLRDAILAIDPPEVEVPEIDWMNEAACRGDDIAIWFGNMQNQRAVERAVEVCLACPVQADCLKYALHIEGNVGVIFRHGIWGGATPVQRRDLHAQRAGKVS